MFNEKEIMETTSLWASISQYPKQFEPVLHGKKFRASLMGPSLGTSSWEKRMYMT